MPTLNAGSAGYVDGLPTALAEQVHATGASPRFALMVAFERPLPVEFDAAAVLGGAPFEWVANNSSKPGRATTTAQCWVAVTTAAHAQQLLADHPLQVGMRAATPLLACTPLPHPLPPSPPPPAHARQALGKFNPLAPEHQARIATQLLAEFASLLAPHCGGSLPEHVHAQAQRWGRAFAARPLGCSYIVDPASGLCMCGDFCASASTIEGAWNSGSAAADALAAALRADSGAR